MRERARKRDRLRCEKKRKAALRHISEKRDVIKYVRKEIYSRVND